MIGSVRRERALSVAALVALCGCQTVYRYTGSAAQQADGAPADSLEGGAGDSVTDDSVADDSVANGPPCEEPQEVRVADCASQCVTCEGDDDGDGLAADPWPQACNELLQLDGFSAAERTGWRLSYSAVAGLGGPSCGAGCGDSSLACSCKEGDRCLDADQRSCEPGAAWSCGQLALDSGVTLQLIDAARLTTAGAKYLVEIKFTPGPAPTTAPVVWSLGMVLNVDGNYSRSCEVWEHHKPVANYPSGYSPSIGLHTVHCIDQAGYPNDRFCTGAWSQPPAVPFVAETSYRLQAWGDSTTQHCRLLTETGGAPLDLKRPTIFTDTQKIVHDLMPLTAGTVRIFARGRSATLDHVEVFAHD